MNPEGGLQDEGGGGGRRLPARWVTIERGTPFRLETLKTSLLGNCQANTAAGVAVLMC